MTESYDQHNGDAPPSFAKYILEKQSEYSLSDDELAYLAGSMFGAGSDTVCILAFRSDQTALITERC